MPSLARTVENPAPASILNKGPANEGAQARADGEDHSHETKIFWTFSERDQITDDQIDQHVDAAASDSLYGPTRDEHGTRARTTSNATSEDQKCDGRYGKPSASKQVGQLTIHWLCCDAGQQKGVDNPGIVVAQIELVGDGACCVGNDCIRRLVVTMVILVEAFQNTCSFKSREQGSHTEGWEYHPKSPAAIVGDGGPRLRLCLWGCGRAG